MAIKEEIIVSVDSKDLEVLARQLGTTVDSLNKMSAAVARHAEMVTRSKDRLQQQAERLADKEMAAYQKWFENADKKAQKEAQLDAQKFTRIQQNMKLMEEMSRVETATSQSQRGVANMSMAFRDLNYIVRDSPYFLKSFSFGILAIGNNLNPFIDSLMRASKESKALGSTLGKELLSFIKGPAGLVFGFSILVTAIQAVVFAMDGAGSKSKSLKERLTELSQTNLSYNQILREMTGEIKNVPFDNLDNLLGGLNKRFEELTTSTNKWLTAFTSAGLSLGVDVTQMLEDLGISGIGAGIVEKGKIGDTQGLVKKQQQGLSDFLTKNFSDIQIISQFTRAELSYFRTALNEISENTLPKSTYNFKLLGEEFSITGKRADDLSKRLEKLLNPDKPKKVLTEMQKLAALVKEIDEVGFSFASSGEDKSFREFAKAIDRIKATLERQGLVWDSRTKQFAFQIAVAFGQAEANKNQPDADRQFGNLTIPQMDYKKVPERVAIEFSTQEKLAIRMANSMLQDIGSIIVNGFVTAWEKAFGEANSLLEQFLMNMSARLVEFSADMLAPSIFKTVFSFIPGVGDFIDAIAPSAAKSGGGGGFDIYVQIGEEPIDNIMYKKLPRQMSRLQREGVI